MYIPNHFDVKDHWEIFAFIEAHAFGQLISTLEGRFYASHIPFALSEDKRSLLCHIAKANLQWQGIEQQEVLVTFQGTHDYVSPSWYESPGVPTWNYQAVHVYGRPKLITDSTELKNLVEALSASYESKAEKPWKPQYKPTLLELIVAIEIQISELQCKYKLSQSRPETDRKQVIKAFENKGAVDMAEAMKRQL